MGSGWMFPSQKEALGDRGGEKDKTNGMLLRGTESEAGRQRVMYQIVETLKGERGGVIKEIRLAGLGGKHNLGGEFQLFMGRKLMVRSGKCVAGKKGEMKGMGGMRGWEYYLDRVRPERGG